MNIKHKHTIILTLIILAALILLVSSFFFKNNNSKKINFAPTPTAVPEPKEYIKVSPADKKTKIWNTFTDDKLKYSIQYPENIIIDQRQSVKDRITAFVFEEDKTASLPGKVTTLYIADTKKTGINGFTAFSRSDCGSNCDTSYKKTEWVNINNVYGIKNPLSNDAHNYYLTDKKQSGSVVNVYVGGYTNLRNKDVQSKINTFEEMIKTIKFSR